MMKKFLPFVVGTLLLTGCESPPPTEYIVIDPILEQLERQTTQAIPVQLQTIDLRTANYVAKYEDGARVADLISPTYAPRAQLAQTLTDGFNAVGYQVVNQGQAQLKFEIKELLSTVTEQNSEYAAKTKVVISVTATQGSKVLGKRYTTRGNFESASLPDPAALELELNRLLEEVCKTILHDKELNTFLHQGA